MLLLPSAFTKSVDNEQLVWTRRGADRNMARFSRVERGGVHRALSWSLLALVCTASAVGCGDGYNTKLKQKSAELRPGMTFQEVTNLLAEFEVLYFTNHPAPVPTSRTPIAERDVVARVFNNNPTSTSISFWIPSRGFGWTDSCRIDFDAHGSITGYTWMYPH